MGGFFLRQPVSLSGFGTFIIDYSGAGVATAASGEIWDIDGSPSNTEQYRVRAFDGGGGLLASIDSPIGEFGDELGASCTSPLDGQPWVFQFSGLSAGIARIKITFIGSKPTNIGLAFNNYDALGESVPTPVPIPTLSEWGTKAMLLDAMNRST